MIRRSKLSALSFAATLLFAVPGGLHAQANGRFKVLIPDFFPTKGADKKFGQKAAENLRDLMNGLLTHQPVPKKDMDDALKQFHLKMEDLDCPKTRQLAAQMQDQVALCASYQSAGGDSVVVTAAFWDTRQNESFQVTPVTADKNSYEAAAKDIFNQFDQYTTELRAAGNCASYEQSQQYPEALGQCDKALGLNPSAQSTRYRKAHILFEMKNDSAAMGQLDTLLQQNPIDSAGLLLAGYISGATGNSDKAVDYYTRYLQLQPGNAQVRMNVAYNLASKAGDPAGAARLIQAGLDRDPDNTDLLTQYGGFAFAAGQKIANAAHPDSSEGGAMPPEAEQWFHKAIDAYQKVFAAKGAETDADLLKTLIAAYVQIGSVNEAISTAEKALQTHPNNDDIWSYYADALHKTGQLDKALTALDRVKEINPGHANVGLRQGQWLIQAGRVSDGVAALKDVAASDPAQAQTAARLVFNSAYSNGIQGGKDYKYASDALTAALTLPNLTPGWKAQLTFWDGYSIYQKAYADQQPQTVKTAKETLPQFQKSKELLSQDGVADYAKSVKVDIKQMLSNVDTFIDIQQKIIQRGSGG
jgi:tetratricopeptide (TPR) repeat protein